MAQNSRRRSLYLSADWAPAQLQHVEVRVQTLEERVSLGRTRMGAPPSSDPLVVQRVAGCRERAIRVLSARTAGPRGDCLGLGAVPFPLGSDLLRHRF